jgi:ABC-type Fe3+-hydroxamate transport system substrate-binding protein
MVFPTKWSLPKSIIEEGQSISFNVENQNSKGITFVSQINENDISTMLIKIAKIIKLNKERELKEQLFKQTIDQLKQTFEKNDLDKLQNLYFDFETDTTPNLDLDEQNGQEPTTIELVDEREEEGR